MRVPYIDLSAQHMPIRQEILNAVDRVIQHGQFILGPEVEALEKWMADYCQTQFAVGVDNGTNALILTMQALGIGVGDEVITVANSFLATGSSIVLAGATPVFVDVGSDMNMDPTQIISKITPNTKAILSVHLTGRPADMDAIVNIAETHNLFVIEDCAQAIGAELNGKRVGSFGIAGCFSFHPLKNLNACGDGGIITTNDEHLYRHLKEARNHGLKSRDACGFWSINARLDTMQAAILMAKTPYLDDWTEKRRQHAALYQEGLDGWLVVPKDTVHTKSVYHTFIVQTEYRDDLQNYLRQNGIDTKIHYPIPIHLQEAAQSFGYQLGDLPITEKQATQILSLPVHPELPDDAISYVIETVSHYMRKRGTA